MKLLIALGLLVPLSLLTWAYSVLLVASAFGVDVNVWGVWYGLLVWFGGVLGFAAAQHILKD